MAVSISGSLFLLPVRKAGVRVFHPEPVEGFALSLSHGLHFKRDSKCELVLSEADVI